jgi:hypothetical protein
MVKKDKSSDNKNGSASKRRPILCKAMIAVIVFVILIFAVGAARLAFNNVSFFSDATFAKRVDKAIELSEKWVEVHKEDIVKGGNIGLLKMLSECDKLKANPVFEEIVESFMEERVRPACWKRLIDPNWPVNELELNQTIEKEAIDNKWILYAMAPDEADVTPEQLYLFEPERWSGMQLSHQLDALVTLRRTSGSTRQLDSLVEHLCNRVSNELFVDMLKIDIGQIAFILRAGFPEKIRRRWIERILITQLPDGGWNDEWYYFVLGRRSVFDLSMPAGDQHDTVLALTVLYLVKYQYSEYFGLR